jgi:hypothetical protein
MTVQNVRRKLIFTSLLCCCKSREGKNIFFPETNYRFEEKISLIIVILAEAVAKNEKIEEKN